MARLADAGAEGDLPEVQLKTARRETRHPWIFRKMVKHRRDLAPGSLVSVRNRNGEFVGRGIYNRGSEIAIRLLTQDPRSRLDRAFLERSIDAALTLRHDILRLPDQTDAYRIVHSEGDGLSGLIVDRYSDVIAIEIFSIGWALLVEDLQEILGARFPGTRFVVRSDRRTESLEGFRMKRFEAVAAARREAREAREAGRRGGAHAAHAGRDDRPPDRTVIHEGPVHYEVDFQEGQKTGFFLDQRANRARIRGIVRDKRVLDAFCYTGGFALAAHAGGARSVVGVDLDEKALAVAAKNGARNGAAVEWVHADVFRHLKDARGRGDRFDVVILDPAKQATHRSELPEAEAAYLDMNRLAVGCIESGGILLSCSCTGLLSEGRFLDILTRAANAEGRDLQVFDVRGADSDHPFALACPQGRYLKAIWSRVR